MQKCKRVFISVSIVVGVLLMSSMVFAVSSFDDVPEDHINADAIAALKSRNIIQGDSETGFFAPDRTLNRAEFAKIIVLTKEWSIDDVEYVDVFPDVSEESWYTDYVLKAYEEGIVVGNGDGTFAPDRAVSMVEALTMALRANNVEVNETPEGSHWYQPYLEIGEKGILDPKTILTPFDAPLPRGEAAQLVVNTFMISVQTLEPQTDFTDKDNDDVASEWEDPRFADIPSCGEDQEFFTSLPIKLSDFASFAPLGNINPPGHVFPSDHGGYYLIDPDVTRYGPNVPVYAPGDGWVTKIGSVEHSSEFIDYNFDFYPCKELKIVVGHMYSLSEKLEQPASVDNCFEYETGGIQYERCNHNVSIEVSSGELIGTVGGGDGRFGLDFGAFDDRLDPAAYANSDRWYDEKRQATCALDYYTDELREQMESKLGSANGQLRTIEPICGEVEQDEPGTAQGAWFAEGIETSMEDPHLSLVHNNISPEWAVFSVGTTLMEKTGLPVGAHEFSPSDSGLVNRDFKDVEPGNAYCFDSIVTWYDGHEAVYKIILELPTVTTLKVMAVEDSSLCGSGPWAFDSLATVNFER